MKILYHKTFHKHYRKRILSNKKLKKQFEKRLKLFIANPLHPILKDHSLKGEKKKYKSFAITGNIRVVYRKLNDNVRLYDVGTHPQVY